MVPFRRKTALTFKDSPLPLCPCQDMEIQHPHSPDRATLLYSSRKRLEKNPTGRLEDGYLLT